MRIVFVTTGRFHVLDLARELAALAHDVQFLSCVPRSRAAQFGLPQAAHRRGLLALAPLLLAQRRCAPALAGRLEILTMKLVDSLAARLLEPCDVFIGMSGLCRSSLSSAQRRYGALTVSAVTSNQPLRVEIEPATLNCLTRTSFPTNSMPNG